METTIAAVYEHGMLRPLAPLGLAEGAQVEIVVINPPLQTPFETLSAIAALPLEVERQETAAREHDHYLYGATENGPQP